MRLPKEGLDLKQYLHGLEYGLIAQALERSGGNIAAAAELLGLKRTTLCMKLAKQGELQLWEEERKVSAEEAINLHRAILMSTKQQATEDAGSAWKVSIRNGKQ